MFEEVKRLLVEQVGVDAGEIKMESELANDLGINSIDLAELIMACEEKYGVTIEDEEIHKLITVGDVVNYLESKK